MWVLQITPSDQAVPIKYDKDPPMTYASTPVLCCQGWASSSSITSPVVPDDILGSRVTIASPTASGATLSSTSEPPNSAMTALCILWLAARKLPMETVGNSCEALLLGCAFLLCRLRWKRQMMIVERLHIISSHLHGLTPAYLFWIGARTV